MKVELIAVLMSLGFNYVLRCHTRKPPAQLSLLNSGSFWKHTCFSPVVFPAPFKAVFQGLPEGVVAWGQVLCRLPAGSISLSP